MHTITERIYDHIDVPSCSDLLDFEIRISKIYVRIKYSVRSYHTYLKLLILNIFITHPLGMAR